MANISSASGKITLKGNWTQEAIDAFEPVLDLWGFYGEYGIQSCYSNLDEEHLTTEFYGCGRWSFSGTLDSFEDWSRQWFKDNPKKPNGEPICTTTEEQYDHLLKIMSENNLIIEIDFEDVEEGVGCHVHEVGQFISEDGSCISYETIDCEDIVPTWDDKDALNAAVDFFEKFLSDVDRRKLRKWVKNDVTPTDIFEDTDDYEEIIGCIGEYGGDPFIDFFLEFSPDTEEWEAFNGAYEDMYGCPVEENIDEGYDDAYFEHRYGDDDEEDEEEDDDEDVNDWDTEPNYPTEDIDRLDFTGKAFVLTGDFQNCDGDRKAVEELIVAKGGRCTGAVSGKTNYLVLGDFGSAGAKKVEKALEEKEKGKDIHIITEYDLFRFLQ